MTTPDRTDAPVTTPEPTMPTFAEIQAEATLNVAISRRYELGQEVKALEAEMKQLSATILAELTERQLTQRETEDLVATVVTQTRSSLSERKLMDRGIPLHILKECKEERTTSFVTVRQKADAKEPEIVY